MTNIIKAIVGAVAEAKGVEVGELNITLHDYINIDAVRELAAGETGRWSLLFELPEHTVAVQSHGEILVDGVHRTDWQ